MSLRLQMLQVARLAPKLLDDSADRVAAFVRSKHDQASGGFVDRAGRPDLYYTVFAIEALLALQRELPAERLRAFLDTFDPKQLDLVHAACLARCRAAVGEKTGEDAAGAQLLDAIERHRAPDGGYHERSDADHGSAYGCFLAVGARQDLGADAPDASAIKHCLDALATGDGGYANHPDAAEPNTPATAAAVTLQHQLKLPLHPNSADVLRAHCLDSGGFFATRSMPLPDLLSTATALHALTAIEARTDDLVEPCLDFVDTLWTGEGGFYGHWAEPADALDVEYTYYALLALGHLSI